MILVLDNSVSMLTPDVGGMPRRDALHDRLVHDFLQNQLGSASDRLSVIVFDDSTARTIFELKPLSTDSGLQVKLALDAAMPTGARAMTKLVQPVEILIGLVSGADAALTENACTHVFFFSDGTESSDQLVSYSRIQKIDQMLRTKARTLHGSTSKQLIGHFVGFGRGDFSAPQALTKALPGSSFDKVDRTLAALSTTVSRFSSTITQTRLSSVVAHARKRELRPVLLDPGAQRRFRTYRRCRLFFQPDMEDLVDHDFNPPLVEHGSSVDLEVSEGAVKQGGERNVFNMHFCSHERRGELKGLAENAWVVKEDKHKALNATRGDADELEFHRKSLVTQTLSAFFSDSFNKEVQRLGLEGVPKIAFMSCCYIETEALQSWPKRCLFAEKHLCGAFRKWNSNSGHVIAMRPPSQSVSGAADGAVPRKRVLFSLGAVAEEKDVKEAEAAHTGDHVERGVPTDDVTQAFSHWTYAGKPVEGPDGKRGRVLVCDIQGNFNETEQTFRLIDPVVHSVGLGEKGLFGDTDRGQRGISDFFASHRCNRVCKLLGLPCNE